MANFFDQFDSGGASPAGGNFFDQFDEPAAEPRPAAPRGRPPRPKDRPFAVYSEPAQAWVDYDEEEEVWRGSQGEPLDYDPFGEGAPGRASAYGRQFVRGAGEIIAGVPEGLAVMGESAARAPEENLSAESRRLRAAIGEFRRQRAEAAAEGETDLSYYDDAIKQIEGQLEVSENRVAAAAAREDVSPEDYAIYGAGEAVRGVLPQSVPQYQGELGAQVAQGFGSAAAFLLSGALTGGAGAAATGATASAAGTYREAKEAGASEQDALLASTIAGAVGTSEAIPVISWLSRRGGAGWQAFVKKVAVDASEEAVQEGFQGTVQNLIAQGIYDPERGTFEDVPESMLVGAIVGGGIGGVSAMRTSQEERDRQVREAATETRRQERDMRPQMPGRDAPAPEVPPRVTDPAAADPDDAPTPLATDVTLTDATALRGAGWSMEDIFEMSPDERQAAMDDALLDDVEPADAVQTNEEMRAFIERERPASSNLTEGDRASPIPNDMIDDGKDVMRQGTERRALPPPAINVPPEPGQTTLAPEERAPAAAAQDPRRARETNIFTDDLSAPRDNDLNVTAEQREDRMLPPPRPGLPAPTAQERADARLAQRREGGQEAVAIPAGRPEREALPAPLTAAERAEGRGRAPAPGVDAINLPGETDAGTERMGGAEGVAPDGRSRSRDRAPAEGVAANGGDDGTGARSGAGRAEDRASGIPTGEPAADLGPPPPAVSDATAREASDWWKGLPREARRARLASAGYEGRVENPGWGGIKKGVRERILRQGADPAGQADAPLTSDRAGAAAPEPRPSTPEGVAAAPRSERRPDGGREDGEAAFARNPQQALYALPDDVLDRIARRVGVRRGKRSKAGLVEALSPGAAYAEVRDAYLAEVEAGAAPAADTSRPVIATPATSDPTSPEAAEWWRGLPAEDRAARLSAAGYGGKKANPAWQSIGRSVRERMLSDARVPQEGDGAPASDVAASPPGEGGLAGERPLRADGRMEPREGDQVYQSVPGPFGTPASIQGEVYRKGDELRVRITGSNALVGGGYSGPRTVRLSDAWTVQGDPEPQRRRDAKRAEQDRRDQEWRDEMARMQQETQASVERAVAAGDSPLTPENARVGLRVTSHNPDNPGEFTIEEIDDSGTAYFSSVENPDEGPRSSPMRGFTIPQGRVEATARAEPSRRGADLPSAVVTPDGQEVDVTYEVVDAADLTAASGDLQPRDRSRAASDEQIAEIAGRLDPQRLMPAREADRGTPVVGPDGMVESGNGRVAAIRRAAETNPQAAAAYRQAIEAAGFAVPEGASVPVLVARRTSDLTDGQRRAFVSGANRSATARMSATEQAQVDMDAMTPAVMALHNSQGETGSAMNRRFVQGFLGNLPQSERAALVAGDGALNSEGRRRIQNALFARAYGERDLIARVAEGEGDAAQSILNAMIRVAPKWAAYRSRIAAGEVKPKFDLTPNLIGALRLVTKARESAAAQSRPVSTVLKEALASGDMFAGDVDPRAEAFVRSFYKGESLRRAFGVDDLSALLEKVAEEAQIAGAAGPSLFGPDAAQAEPVEVVNAARRSIEGAGGDLFGARGADRGRERDRERAGEDRGDEQERGRPADEANGDASPAERVDGLPLTIRKSVRDAIMDARRGLPAGWEVIAQEREGASGHDIMLVAPGRDGTSGAGGWREMVAAADADPDMIRKWPMIAVAAEKSDIAKFNDLPPDIQAVMRQRVRSARVTDKRYIQQVFPDEIAESDVSSAADTFGLMGQTPGGERSRKSVAQAVTALSERMLANIQDGDDAAAAALNVEAESSRKARREADAEAKRSADLAARVVPLEDVKGGTPKAAAGLHRNRRYGNGIHGHGVVLMKTGAVPKFDAQIEASGAQEMSPPAAERFSAALDKPGRADSAPDWMFAEKANPDSKKPRMVVGRTREGAWIAIDPVAFDFARRNGLTFRVQAKDEPFRLVRDGEAVGLVMPIALSNTERLDQMAALSTQERGRPANEANSDASPAEGREGEQVEELPEGYAWRRGKGSNADRWGVRSPDGTLFAGYHDTQAAAVEAAREALDRRGRRESAPEAARRQEPAARPEPKAAAPSSGESAAQRAKRAARLREVANGQIRKAQEARDADRQTNTARRARMAASAEAEAAVKERRGRIALVIADMIEADAAGALDVVRSMKDVETLDIQLQRARDDRLRAESPDTPVHVAREKQGAPRPEDAAYYKPRPFMLRMANDLRQLNSRFKLGGAQVLNRFTGNDVHQVRGRGAIADLLTFADKLKKKSNDWAAKDLAEEAREWRALDRLGLTGEGAGDVIAAFAEARAEAGGEVAADPLKKARRALAGAKIPGFFQTPEALARRMVEIAAPQAGERVLEPSAGAGRIADAVRGAAPEATLEVIEKAPGLQDILRLAGHDIVATDFMEFDGGPYDVIVMNPPFEKGQDMEHVRRAWDMLAPGGRLAAITGRGAWFRSDRQATEFREWAEEQGAEVEELPSGTFKESGTGTETNLVTLRKPEARGAAGGGRGEPSVGQQAKEYRAKYEQPGDVDNGSVRRLIDAPEWWRFLSDIEAAGPDSEARRRVADAATLALGAQFGTISGPVEVLILMTPEGVPVEMNVGAERSVGLTPAGWRMLRTVGADLYATHNHPSSTALGPADIAMMSYHGMGRMVAMGHDGDRYDATPAGVRGLDSEAVMKALDGADAILKGRVQKGINEGLVDIEVATKAHRAIAMLAAERAGLIRDSGTARRALDDMSEGVSLANPQEMIADAAAEIAERLRLPRPADAESGGARASGDAAPGAAGRGQGRGDRPAGGASREPAGGRVSQGVEGPAPSGRIEDFGQKIAGARKDYADKLKNAASIDVASAPLAKSWPEPDYQKLIDGGADPRAVAFARAARDEVPTRPRQRWKLSRWVEQTELLRGMTSRLLSGDLTMAEIERAMADPKYKRLREDLMGRVDLYEAVGHGKSLKGVKLRPVNYSRRDRETGEWTKFEGWAIEREAKKSAFGNWPRTLVEAKTKDAAVAEFKRRVASIETQPKASKQVRFDIYSRRGGGEYFIGKKLGRDVLQVAGPFDDAAAARTYRDENWDSLAERLEQAKRIPAERKESNSPRVGVDHRNGQDVTPEMFADAFGFRGVQFGNYVEGDRRQQDLNETYDGLMDLAGVLNIPARALSLNGELGLAFGARGKGGARPAKAHYEPDHIVINLTKKAGAGSLAHEWWHGLDNYFSRMGGRGTAYMTERGRSAAPEGVRPEVAEAFRQVMEAIRGTGLPARSQMVDRRRSKPYWGTSIEMSARAFESYVIARLRDQNGSNDYLANVVSKAAWDAEESLIAAFTGQSPQASYPYPTEAEMGAIREAFDGFFAAVETEETDAGTIRLYRRTDTPSPEAMADLRRRLDDMGLSGVDLVTRRPDATNDGAFELHPDGRALIEAMDAQTLDHEAIHALYNMGAFTDAEWTAMSRRAGSLWMKKHDVRRLYPREDFPDTSDADYEALLVEEAIAEEFAAWRSGARTRLGEAVRTAFERIASVIEAVGNWMRGNGFQSAGDVFAAVDRGETGARLQPGGARGEAVSRERRRRTPPRRDPASDVSDFMDMKVVNDGALPGLTRAIRKVRAAGPEAAMRWLRAFDSGFVNQFSPVRALELRAKGATKLPVGMDSAFKSIETAVNDSGRSEILLRHGAASYDENGAFVPKEGTKGLVPMLEQLGSGEAVTDWMHWMAARRAQALKARDIKTPMTEADIKRGLAKETPLFRRVAEDWRAFNNANLDFAVQSGLVAPKAAEAMKADETYIPFYRSDPDEDGDFDPAIRGPIYSPARGVNDPKSGIKAIKGGDKLKLNNLVENMILNSKVMVSGSMRNMAANKVADLLEEAGEGRVVPASQATGGVEGGFVKFKRDGRAMAIKPDDQAMVLALAGMRPQQLNSILQFMADVASFFRQGITLAPAFMIRNAIRGAVSTGVLTGKNLGPYNNTITGMAKALRNADEAVAFKARAGMGDFRFGNSDIGLGKNDVLIGLGLGPKTVGYRFRQLVGAAEHVGTATELADRIALQENLIRDGVRPDEAAYQALNVINYGRRGSNRVLQTMLPLIPFLNARIQGLARLLEAPSGERGMRNAIMPIALRGAVLSAFSAALWAWNNEDDEKRERYEAEPLWRRLNYHIIYGEDRKYLIPKAFEIGALFGTIPELMLEAGVQGDAEEVSPALTQTLVNTFSFNPIPAAVLPMLEVSANYNFFTGRELEGMRLRNRLRLDRVDYRTSEVSKAAADTWLMETLSLSPVQIEHLLDGYGGIYSSVLTSSVDMLAAEMGMAPSRPEGVFGEFPGRPLVENVFGSLVKPTDADPANRFIGEFYDLSSEVQRIMLSARDARRNSEIGRAQELLRKFPRAPAAYSMVNKAGDQIGELNTAIRNIRERKGMSAEEKRRRLTPMIERRNAIATRVVQILRKLEARQRAEFSDAE